MQVQTEDIHFGSWPYVLLLAFSCDGVLISAFLVLPPHSVALTATVSYIPDLDKRESMVTNLLKSCSHWDGSTAPSRALSLCNERWVLAPSLKPAQVKNGLKSPLRRAQKMSLSLPNCQHHRFRSQSLQLGLGHLLGRPQANERRIPCVHSSGGRLRRRSNNEKHLTRIVFAAGLRATSSRSAPRRTTSFSPSSSFNYHLHPHSRQNHIS